MTTTSPGFVGLCLLLCATLVGCTQRAGLTTTPSGSSLVASGDQEFCVPWNLETLTLIQADGCYGRMIRLQNGELLCCFELDGGISVRHSDDDGRTWREPIQAAAWAYGALANPDLAQLSDGTVLCVYDERPNVIYQNSNKIESKNEPAVAGSSASTEVHPFAISLARSNDSGAHWGLPATLYSADTKPENGCWEPTAIQLPSGEVQLYFANESPYRESTEQEITLLRSFDEGKTWSTPETVSFRAGFRDGMPSPILLNNGKAIALAIEDNGFNGNLQPAIVFTSLKDNWHSGAVGGDSPRRWSALNPPLPFGAYAGAPSLRQLPSGTTLLSFQEDNIGELMKSHMVVRIGDAAARNFAHPSHPFPITPGTPQLWNSLFVKNATTVTALSSTTIDGVYGVWSIDGRIGE